MNKTNQGVLRDSNGENSPWNKVIGPVYTVASLALALNIDEFKIAELQAKGKLLALVMADGYLAFPAFQFTSEMKVTAGLLKVWAILGEGAVSDWTMASWLQTPFSSGDSMTMIGMLSQKDGFKKVTVEANDMVRNWLQ